MEFKKYIEKYQKVLTKPGDFFKDHKSEREFFPALNFYLILMISFSILSLILSFYSISFSGFTLITFILQIISSIIISLIALIIFGAFIYVGVLICNKGKGNFNGLIVILLYALPITFLYSFVSGVVSTGFEMYHPIQPELSEFTGNNFEAIVRVIQNPIHKTRLIITAIISLLSLIHLLSVITIGVSITQGMKKGKSFLSMVSVPLIILILISIAIFLGLRG